MDLILDTSGTVPIYQQIAQQVLRRIAQGALKPGDPLPSVRQLALDLTINPNTVARAYLELEFQGVLQKRQGQGTYIGPDAAAASRREGARMVAELMERAVAEASTFGVRIGELEALFQQAVKAQAKSGARR